MISKLRRIRLSHGRGLNEVAREVGISPSSLSRLERGISQYPPHAERLARYWGDEIDETEILFPYRQARSPGKTSDDSRAA